MTKHKTCSVRILLHSLDEARAGECRHHVGSCARKAAMMRALWSCVVLHAAAFTVQHIDLIERQLSW